MKIRLKYTGSHQPQEEIEVDEDKVSGLLARGDYVLADKTETVIIKKPDEYWKEKDIKNWIERNNIPIDYDIRRDTKKEILKRLKDGGYL